MKNIFKDIFGRVWALWGLISFTATFILILPFAFISVSFINPIRSQLYFIGVSKVWMRMWLFLVGCPIRITGRHYFEPGKNYIVVFNHNALLDVPLSAPFVPGATKTIAKDSFSRIPLFGWFYKKGSVLVNRKSEKSRLESFQRMKNVLQAGMHMCIYPEGTRNRTDKPLKPFFDGAFRLATETNKAIIPCILSGTKKAMPIHKPFYLLPTPLEMTFLPPQEPGQHAPKAFKEIIYSIMEAEIKKNYY